MRVALTLERAVLRTGRGRALLLLVVLSASLGFALFAATGARRTATALDRFIAWSKPPDVQTGGYGGEVPVAERLDEVAALPIVAESRRLEAIGINGARLPDGSEVPPTRLSAGAVEDLATPFDRAIVLRGHVPTDPATGDGVIDFLTAERLDLDVGDRIVLHAAAGPDGHQTRSEVPVQVRAVLSVPESLPTLAGFHFNGVILGPAFLEAHPDLVDPWSETLAMRLRPGATVDDLRAALEAKGLGDIDLAPNRELVEVGAQRLFTLEATVMWVAALLALAVGLPIAYQLARRDALANRPAIDTVLALGASRRQFLQAGALRGLGFGALAVVLGGAGAIAASPLSPVGMARNAEIDRGVWIDGTVLALGGLLFVAAVVALAVAGTWTALRPARDPLLRVGRARFLSRRAPLSYGVRVVTGRAGPGAVAGLGALVLVAVLVVAMVVDATSLAALPHDGRAAGGVWDAFVQTQPGGGEAVDRVLDRAPEVDAHGAGGWTALQVGPEFLYAVSLPRVPGMEPAITRGRAPRGPHEVALGAEAMRRLGVGIGDPLDATVQGGDRSRPLHLTVTGETILAAPLFQAHAPDDAALLATNPGAPSGDQGSTELIRFTEGRDPEATLDALMTRMPEDSLAFAFARGQRGDVIAVERLQGLLRALLIMAIGLVAASLLHQLLVTSRRQRRELATLRSLGFTSFDVAEVGTAAGATIALLAIAVAVPLGIAAGSLAWRQLARTLVVLPGTTITVPSLVLGAAVAAAAAAVVAAALALGGNRGSPARILRTE